MTEKTPETLTEQKPNILQTPIGEIELIDGKLSQVHSPKYFSSWIEKFGEGTVEGIDVEGTRLGHACEILINDDSNFYLPEDDELYYGVMDFEESRLNALSRIEWELRIPGMPDEVLDKLTALSEVLSGPDWENRDERAEAYEEFEGIREFIANYVLLNFEIITKSLINMTNHNRDENIALGKLRDWMLPMLMNGQVSVS